MQYPVYSFVIKLYRDVREEFKRDFPDTYLTNSFLKISKTDGESLFELLTTFSEIFQYIIKQINDHNKENHKLRDIDQLLRKNIKEMYDLQ